MDNWVERAIAKWPDVPALFGWLGLSRQGQWLIQGETVTHPRIVDTMSRNYGCDAHGRWFFQNGPQRGYVALEYTPLIGRVQSDDRLLAHTGIGIERITALYLDEHSTAVADSPDGATLIQGADLAWVLNRLRQDKAEVDDQSLAEALAMPSGRRTGLDFVFEGRALPVHRCDMKDMPATLGFVRDPQPREGEKHS